MFHSDSSFVNPLPTGPSKWLFVVKSVFCLRGEGGDDENTRARNGVRTDRRERESGLVDLLID